MVASEGLARGNLISELLVRPVARPAGLGSSRNLAAPVNASTVDWPELHQNPTLSGTDPNSSISTANASDLGVAWATDMYGPALDSPAVAYDPLLNETLAYVGTEYGDVVGVNVANGQIVWGTWLGSGVRSSPVVNEGDLFVATYTTPAVYKLNATTGGVDCSYVTKQVIEATPTVDTPPGGVRTLYIGTQGTSVAGPFIALNASNCKLEWQFTGYHTPGTGSWDSASYVVNAAGTPMVLFGTDNPDESIYALNALTGQLLWRFQCDNPPGDWDVGAGVTISPPGANGFAQGVAYATNKIGIAYALNLNNGTLIWETDFDKIAGTTLYSVSTPALDGSNLVLGYASGLFDLNSRTGAEIWNYRDPSRTGSLSSPAIAGAGSDAVVVTGLNGGALEVVSLATGTQLYQYQTGGYITASPAVVGGNIIIASSDSFLYDLSVGGGNDETLPSTTVTSPADVTALPNPNGDQIVYGNATDVVGVARVEVAVQSGGPAGPWWDAANGSWSRGPVDNPATLVAPGAKASSWSFSYPVPNAGGTYSVTAYAVSSAGQSDIVGANTEFNVLYSTSGPNFEVSPSFAAPGETVNVTGGGFADSEIVEISLAGVTIASATASSSGGVPITHVKIPITALFGRSALEAIGDTSGRAASALLTIGNSWDQLGYAAAHTNYEPDNTLLSHLSQFDHNWVHLAWHFDPETAFEGSPVVVDGVAYVGDSSGQLYAVDDHNGGLIWTWTLASGAALNSSPAVDPALGLLFVTDSAGVVHAIATASGNSVWNTTVGGELTAPAYANGEIFVASTTGAVAALSEATGKLSWSVSIGSAITGAPAVDVEAKLVVVGTASGAVEALDLGTGSTAWSYVTGGPVTAAVTIAAGMVFAGSADGNAYALNLTTGARDWSYQTGGAIADSGSYTDQGTTTEGTNEGGVFVIGSNDGDLFVLKASTGALDFSHSYGSAVVGLSTVYGVIIVETASGVISAVRFDSGIDVWNYKTGSTLTSSPLIVDSAIYVAATTGNLYAFTSFGQPPD